MRVSKELYKVRVALCANTKEERQAILDSDEASKIEFMTRWNKGVVCARCQHFTSLGRDCSGLCGTCSAVKKTDYTRPEEFCGQFQKRDGIS